MKNSKLSKIAKNLLSSDQAPRGTWAKIRHQQTKTWIKPTETEQKQKQYFRQEHCWGEIALSISLQRAVDQLKLDWLKTN